MAKIAVIMSVFNDSKHLKEAIDSILNQTFKDFEFIICNDCSTDDSLLIMKDYEKKDKRIKIIDNLENVGLAASLNKCLEVVNSEYVARMDSDDISLPNRFQEELDFLETNKHIDVVSCKCNVIDENSEVYKDFSIYNGEVKMIDAIKKTQVIHPTVMIRKRALDEVNGYTVNFLTQRAEDYDLWCKLLSTGHRIYNIDKTLFHYREGLTAMKKRKYKYRIQEARIKYYWMKKQAAPLYVYLFAFKPLIVGLIPSQLMNVYKRFK